MPTGLSISYVCCDNCHETWSWTVGERRTATFNEWYQMLDDLLLDHLIDNPDCWQRHNSGRRWAGRPGLPTESQPGHARD